MFKKYTVARICRWVGLSVALAGAAVLSGCATPTVAARVTSFQQWPGDASGQTYRFAEVDPVQANNLEYQSYRDMVRAGVGATGLVEAQAKGPARFTVTFEYGVAQTQVMVRRAYDPYFYGGYGGGYYGPRWGGAGFGFWGPEWVDVPMVAYRNHLSLRILDNSRNGAEVYRSSAYINTERDDLVRTMPYLVRAIFDNFPGNNGSERQVAFPLDR
ncbi:hypothetical protein CEG14_18235 [Bordetella genomosp. 1]|uniref:DUF4136 domain-containing protein n=1 Tax=Bordetella genomosp. 1 TaxID=1395607 RepID=A0A261S766_9BORD|nr:DUF4136 domain-containing protein [Bordetella genomosp. 1]OZI32827.1 hypothetical protein CEG14_18235 [Bordetella genomosp. 1]OZI65823.1 hypothetical protein CAL27_12515 [Bordetella genomosp. 1]